MPRTTMWKIDDDNNSYEKIVKKFNNSTQKYKLLDTDFYPNFKITSLLSDKQNLSKGEVEYSYYECSYDSLTKGNDRITSKLLVYCESNDKTTGVITEKAPSNALTFLRAILGYDRSKKNQVIRVENNEEFLDESLFLWAVKGIYEKNDGYDLKDGKLTFDSLDGWRGRMDSGYNKVSTSGNDVMNMLTTLSFLIDEGSLTEITFLTSLADHHDLSVTIHDAGSMISVGISEKNYKGPFLTNANQGDKLIAILTLFVHLELIPNILIAFNGDPDKLNVRSDLTGEVKNDVLGRLQDKVTN